MLGSYKLFRQIAHVSVQIAQDHIATAFHFFISKRLPLRGRAAKGRLGPGLSTSIIVANAENEVQLRSERNGERDLMRKMIDQMEMRSEPVSQGLRLDVNTNELAQCLAEFKDRHAALVEEIEAEEQKKKQITSDIQILSKRLVSINETIGRKVEERNASAKLVEETEAAYTKILESSQTLLTVLKRESAAIQRQRHVK